MNFSPKNIFDSLKLTHREFLAHYNRPDKESFQHDLVEFAVGSSGQKSVQLDEHVQVEIIALGGLSDGLSVFFVADINSHVFCFSFLKSRKMI